MNNVDNESLAAKHVPHPFITLHSGPENHSKDVKAAACNSKLLGCLTGVAAASAGANPTEALPCRHHVLRAHNEHKTAS
jgi:hypothetical protein